jgi:hypothetical protein
MPIKIPRPPSAQALRQKRRRTLRAEAKIPEPDLVARVLVRAVAFAMARGNAQNAKLHSAREFWRDIWHWCCLELVTTRGFPIEGARAAVQEATAARVEFARHFQWRSGAVAGEGGTEAAQISENSEAPR